MTLAIRIAPSIVMKPARTISRLVLIAAVLVVLGGPLFGLVIAVWQEAVMPGHVGAPDIMRIATIFARTVLLCAGTTLATMLLSCLAAMFFLRLGRGRIPLIAWLSLSTIAVPGFVHAAAWLELERVLKENFGVLLSSGLPNGIASAALMTAAMLPLGLAFSLTGFAWAERAAVEAGRIYAGPLRALFRVEIPMARSALGAGAALVFALSMMEYGIPSMFDVRVLALETFVQFSVSPDLAPALAISVPNIVLMVAVILVLARTWRHLGRVPDRGRQPVGMRLPRPPWLDALAIMAAAATLAPLVLLVATLVVAPLLRDGFATLSGGALVTLRNSALIAFGAAAVSVTAVFAVAPGLHRSRALLVILLMPLDLPAPLLALGLVHFWNQDLAGVLYGTVAMPILACVARFAPIVALMAFHHFRTLDVSLLEAAAIYRRSLAADWLAIRLPLIGSGALAGFFLIFALTIGELSATLLVVPPGMQTAALRVYALLHYGSSEEVAAIAGMMVILSVSATMLAFAAMSRIARRPTWKRETA